MGEAFSCANESAFSTVIPEMATLSPEQRSAIQQTWAIPAENPIDSGEAILLAYFERFPHNQQKFAAFKNVPLDSLKGSSGFRSHAGRIVTVFAEAIASLNDDNYLSALESIWSKIGESHSKRKISRQAFNELREILLSILSQVCSLDEEQSIAWSTFLEIVYNIIFEKVQQESA